MNKALIPQFIADTLDTGNTHGVINATVLFVDISGFTPLTTRLMSRGKPGAEIISSTLNKIFTPMIEAVHEHGGFISTFAGDAFTAAFPATDESTHNNAHAAAAALACQATANREHMQHTRFGEFPLEISAGIGHGEVEWGVVGAEDTLKSWYFRGTGIEEAVRAEAAADRGEIRVTADLAGILASGGISLKTDGDEHTCPVLPRSAAIGTGYLPGVRNRFDSIPAEGVHRYFRPIDDLPLDTAGEFRDVTSVFIAADAGDHYREINTTISCVLRSTRAYGGYFDMLDFGDKGCVMLVAFGAPLARGKDAERALNFATDVLDSLGYRARIGVSRGTVFTGYVGSPERATYTTLGESVNLAARIAVGNEPESAYTDASTMQAAGRTVPDSSAETRPLKGYEQPITLYPITPRETQPAPETGESTTSSQSPELVLAGREKEMRELTAWIETASTTDGLSMAELSGEAGIGKTALVRRALTGLQHARGGAMELRADPILGKSLSLFDNLLPSISRELNVELSGEHDDSVWISELLELASGIDSYTSGRLNELADALPVLKGSTGGSGYQSREPRARFEMTVELIVELVRLVSRRRSLVLVIDDLHAADEDSIAALERMVFDLVDEPLTVIALYRSTGTESGTFLRLPEQTDCHRITLQPLTRVALRELSTRQLGGPASDALADFLASRVGGNPFYAIEMLSYLKDSGGLRQGSEGYEPNANSPEVPQNILGVLIERIDTYSSDVRRTSSVAAVLGLEFSVAALEAILPDVDITSALADGAASGLWYESQTGTYRFSQPLIREAIISTQLDANRRAVHREVMRYLLKAHGDDAAYAADIAYHAESADLSSEARRHLWRAFEYARDGFKNAKAVDFLNRYLAQKPPQLHALEGYIELGAIHEQTGDWEHAADSLTYALGLAELAESETSKVRVLNQLCRILGRMGESQAAIAAGRRAVFYSDRTAEQPGLAEALMGLGRALWTEGRLDEAEEHLQRSVSVAAGQNDGKTEGLALYYCGVIRRDRNDFKAALELYQRSEERLRAHADSQLATFPVYDMAVLLQYEGDLEKSQRYFEQVLEVYNNTGYRSGASAAVLNLGVLRDRRGDFETAIRYFEQAREIAESIGERLAIAYTLFSMGATYYKMFENRKALSYLKDSLRIMRSLGAKGYYAFPLSYLAALYSRSRDPERVVSLCGYHLAAIRDVGSDPENGLALLSLARTLAREPALSDEAERQLKEVLAYYDATDRSAEALFLKAIQISDDASYINTLIPAHYHYYRYLASQGRNDEARPHLREAYRLAKAATWERFVRTLEERHSEKDLYSTAQA